MRVSFNMIHNFSQYDNQDKIQELNKQLSTGNKINKPSDDPIGFYQSSNLSKAISRFESENNSIIYASNYLSLQEGTLFGIDNQLSRLKELHISYLNGTKSPEDLNNIEKETNEIINQMISTANNQDGNGNYLFSSAEINKPSIDNNFDVQQQSGQKIIRLGERNIDLYRTLPESLSNFIKEIKQNGLSENSLNLMDTFSNDLKREMSYIGSHLNTIDNIKNFNENNIRTLKEFKANIMETNIPEAISELEKQKQVLEIAMKSYLSSSSLSLFKMI